MLLRILLISIGTICLIIGITGIFIPGLPTTPFLLLTAGLYVRGSDRLYQGLIRNRFVGGYISEWQNNRTLSRKTKIGSISLMWVMILVSVTIIIHSPVAQVIVILTGLTGTYIMGFIIPTGPRR